MSGVPAWSHSRLEAFNNCPRQFYEVQIAKTVQDVRGEAVIWGEEVHKHFENYLSQGTPLPQALLPHAPFLQFLTEAPGTPYVEERIALDTSLQPCAFFDKSVWFRGVIDYLKVHGDTARVVDHKTGKVHSKFGQLKLFALHTFIRFPEVQTVRAEFYWTQNLSTTGQEYTRDQIPTLWSEFTPSLGQYVQAFQTNVWQPRQSGLCNGWCPVTGCEFWRPKRKR